MLPVPGRPARPSLPTPPPPLPNPPISTAPADTDLPPPPHSLLPPRLPLPIRPPLLPPPPAPPTITTTNTNTTTTITTSASPTNNLLAELRQRAAQARPPPLPVFNNNPATSTLLTTNIGLSGLGNDRPRSELTRQDIPSFGRSRELHETLMRNVRNQIQTIQSSEHIIAIETFVRQIRRLHPAPSTRVSLAEAKNLLQQSQRIRDYFPTIDDDDIWILAVNWPRSQLERLQEGVTNVDRIYKDLTRQKERIHEVEKQRNKSSSSLLFPSSPSQSNTTAVNAKANIDTISSIAADNVSSSSSGSSSTITTLPPLPLATARNLETIGNGLCHTASLLYRSIDTLCCYIVDESKDIFGQVLEYLVRGTDFIVEALENLSEKLKIGGGTKWDINSRIQQAHSIAEALVSIHRQTLGSQRNFAICHGRRSLWDNQTYLRVANSLSMFNNGQLAFTERDLVIEESEQEREQYRQIGAYDAYIEDEHGKPYIQGALSESASLFVEEITTGGFATCTAEKIATAYTKYLERGRLEGYQRIRPRGIKETVDGIQDSSDDSVNANNTLLSSSTVTDTPLTNEEKQTIDGTLTRILELMRSGHMKMAISVIHESIEKFYEQDTVNSVSKVPPIVTAMSSSGMTIARAAASHGAANVLKEILSHKYNLLTDVAGGTILHAIAGKGGQAALDMLRTLFEVYPYDASSSNVLPSGFLDNVNSGGITAMHLFARHSVSSRGIAAQCLLEMIKAGADPLVQGSQRKTPLQSFVEAHIPKEMIQLEKSLPSSSTIKSTTRIASASPIFSAYLYSPRLSDVTLIIPSATGSVPHTIPAHAIILSAQSSFFKVILEEKSWAESVTRQIDLTTNPNLTESTLRKILTYLYTGHIDLIPGDAKMGLEILYAANLFSIHTLMHDLQSFLITSCLNNNTSWAIFDTLMMLRGGSHHYDTITTTKSDNGSNSNSGSSTTVTIDELLRIQISAAHHILLHYHDVDMQQCLPTGPEGTAEGQLDQKGFLGNHYALQQVLAFFHDTK